MQVRGLEAVSCTSRLEAVVKAKRIQSSTSYSAASSPESLSARFREMRTVPTADIRMKTTPKWSSFEQYNREHQDCSSVVVGAALHLTLTTRCLKGLRISYHPSAAKHTATIAPVGALSRFQ